MFNQMKKVVASVLMVLAVVVGLQVAQPQKAEAYTYWNGDPNYILLFQSQGVARWLDVSSITIKKNQSDEQVWAEIVVVARGNDIIKSNVVWYAWSDRSAFASNDGENWNHLELGDRSDAAAAGNNGFRIGYYKAFGYGIS